jgi:predicted RNA-binding protein associated with RNAse of E/G family
MYGKNPNEEIQKLLQSGKISQEQLNRAQQMANQISGMFK